MLGVRSRGLRPFAFPESALDTAVPFLTKQFGSISSGSIGASLACAGNSSSASRARDPSSPLSSLPLGSRAPGWCSEKCSRVFGGFCRVPSSFQFSIRKLRPLSPDIATSRCDSRSFSRSASALCADSFLICWEMLPIFGPSGCALGSRPGLAFGEGSLPRARTLSSPDSVTIVIPFIVARIWGSSRSPAPPIAKPSTRIGASGSSGTPGSSASCSVDFSSWALCACPSLAEDCLELSSNSPFTSLKLFVPLIAFRFRKRGLGLVLDLASWSPGSACNCGAGEWCPVAAFFA